MSAQEQRDDFRAKLATALKMDMENHWRPKVSVQARGHLAEKLLELAEEHDVPVVTDADMAEDLQFLDVGTYLPVELYEPVAEILAHIYMLSEKAKKE